MNENLAADKATEDINKIAAFLAKRHIRELSGKALSEKFGIDRVELLIVLGSSMPYIAELGADAYMDGLAEEIMLAGGIGHSTKYLMGNILRDEGYNDIEVKDRPEADILKEVMVRHSNIDRNKIIIENKSANCGANACEALNTLRERGKVPGSVLILQDPTMQLRTHASFQKEWAAEKTLIISYAPFIPKFVNRGNGMEFANRGIKGLWEPERFIDLIMGEIPRLRDDDKGYGPNGKGFIAHVDVPEEIVCSYQRLLARYDGYADIRLRK